jgi:hypothetical protein
MGVLTTDSLYRYVAAGLVTSLVAYLSNALYGWWRLRHIPGPPLAGFSALWLTFAVSKGQNHELWTRLDNKYGRVVRVGPNMVTTSDPVVIRRMASARSMAFKDEWYSRAQIGSVDILFTLLHPKTHDDYKAKAAAGYSGRDAGSIEQGIDEQIESALALIRRKYISKDAVAPATDSDKSKGDVVGGVFRPMDMAKFAGFFTLDVITKIAFGDEFGNLRHDDDVTGFMSELQSWLPLSNTLTYTPRRLYDLLTSVLNSTVRLDENRGLGLLTRCVSWSWCQR